MLKVAARLSPRDPHHWTFLNLQAVALLGLKRYEEVVDMERRALLSSNAGFHPYAPLISALGHLGRKKEAQDAIEQLRHLQPGYSCERHRQQFPIFDAFAEHYVDGMRKAGLPEN
jgi:hypothetical protein